MTAVIVNPKLLVDRRIIKQLLSLSPFFGSEFSAVVQQSYFVDVQVSNRLTLAALDTREIAMTFSKHGTTADMSSYRTIIRTRGTQANMNGGSNHHYIMSPSLMRPTSSTQNTALNNSRLPRLNHLALLNDNLTDKLSIQGELPARNNRIDKALVDITRQIDHVILNYKGTDLEGLAHKARNEINGLEQSNSYLRGGMKAGDAHKRFSRCLIQKLYVVRGRAWEV